MSLKIRPLSYALGVEITGVDLRKPVDDATFRDIHAAFLDHCVLLFRGQSLTREQHIAFGRKFGELQLTPPHRIAHMAPDHPELVLVTNKPNPSAVPLDARYQGEGWHSDRSFVASPAKASLLRGVTLPSVGGDTLFSNGYLAYEQLSDGMKALLEGLHGVHVQEDNRTLDRSTPERYAASLRLTRAAHPVVRTHPDSGRKALFLAFRIKKFDGMTVDESAPLLKYLLDHATRPQYVYRHVWQKDDLVVWDNRCTMHNAVNDYDHAQVRHMERVTVKGNESGYVYEGSLD